LATAGTVIKSGEVKGLVKVLGPTFFDRSAEKVARDLIGCRLHWRDGDESESRNITETEAYTGPDDLASHAGTDETQRGHVRSARYILCVLCLRAPLDAEHGDRSR
jgi:hypothetical protein